jgi:hypothetical protein
MKLSVYDYLYQYNNLWKKNPQEEEHLISKEDKKFTFNKVVVFRVVVNTRKKAEYQAISYVFNVGNFLYDLSYKRHKIKGNPVDLEVFNDIFYSMQIDSLNLFSHGNKKYLKEEEIQFKE